MHPLYIETQQIYQQSASEIGIRAVFKCKRIYKKQTNRQTSIQKQTNKQTNN